MPRNKRQIMNQCNFCDFQKIKTTAGKCGKLVTTKRSQTYGGTRVYVHDKHRDLQSNPFNHSEDPDFIAWYEELTDFCIC